MRLKVSKQLEFVLIPEGTHDALVFAVVELGKQKRLFEGKEQKPEDMVKLLFEVPGVLRTDGNTEIISSRDLTATNSERGNFFKMVKAILNQPITSEDMEKVLLEQGPQALLGKPVSLLIKHIDLKDNKQMAVIDQVLPLDARLVKDMAPSKREPFVFVVDKPDLDVFKTKLSKNTRQKIMDAVDADEFPSSLKNAYAETESASNSSGVSVEKSKSIM